MSSSVLTDEKSVPVLADPEQIIPVLSDAEKTAYEMLSWLFVDTELMPKDLANSLSPLFSKTRHSHSCLRSHPPLRCLPASISETSQHYGGMGRL